MDLYSFAQKNLLVRFAQPCAGLLCPVFLLKQAKHGGAASRHGRTQCAAIHHGRLDGLDLAMAAGLHHVLKDVVQPPGHADEVFRFQRGDTRNKRFETFLFRVGQVDLIQIDFALFLRLFLLL